MRKPSTACFQSPRIRRSPGLAEAERVQCTRCGKCVEACSFEVLEWIDDAPVAASPSNCKLCLECEKSCPVDAISHEEWGRS